MLKRFKKAFDRIYAQNKLLRELRGKRTIILVAGHHQKLFDYDQGAVANNTTEHEEVKKICLKAWEILSRDNFNAIVCPFNLNMMEKIRWINKNFPDCILLSVHLNAAYDEYVTGYESWYLTGNDKMRACAEEANRIMGNYMNTRNRGEKGDLTNHHGRLGILRDTIPTDELLLELGFITNTDDLTRARLKGAQCVAEISKMLFYK